MTYFFIFPYFRKQFPCLSQNLFAFHLTLRERSICHFLLNLSQIGSFLECKIAAFWQVMILCRGVIYHVPNTLKFAERNVINHAPTKFHCSKGSISRHEHVQISLCSTIRITFLSANFSVLGT